MANLTIILLLGIAIGVLAAIMLVPAAYAFAMGAFDASLGFGVAALITAFVGVALFAATRGRMRPLSRIQTVAFALVVWTVLPLFAAIPFVAAPMNLTFISAVFEATSALPLPVLPRIRLSNTLCPTFSGLRCCNGWVVF